MMRDSMIKLLRLDTGKGKLSQEAKNFQYRVIPQRQNLKAEELLRNARGVSSAG